MPETINEPELMTAVYIHHHQRGDPTFQLLKEPHKTLRLQCTSHNNLLRGACMSACFFKVAYGVASECTADYAKYA